MQKLARLCRSLDKEIEALTGEIGGKAKQVADAERLLHEASWAAENARMKLEIMNDARLRCEKELTDEKLVIKGLRTRTSDKRKAERALTEVTDTVDRLRRRLAAAGKELETVEMANAESACRLIEMRREGEKNDALVLEEENKARSLDARTCEARLDAQRASDELRRIAVNVHETRRVSSEGTRELETLRMALVDVDSRNRLEREEVLRETNARVSASRVVLQELVARIYLAWRDEMTSHEVYVRYLNYVGEASRIRCGGGRDHTLTAFA